MEETIQKRRGRRKKKKTGKIGKKEKEPLEEVKPSEEEYEQTGQEVYGSVLFYFFWNILFCVYKIINRDHHTLKF